MSSDSIGDAFEIRVQGRLGPEWSAWFDGLAVEFQPNGETLLTGLVADQSELLGILVKIGNLGLPLVLVRRVEGGLPE
ncbi:MAG TPA: hypothetical protein VLY63_06925 [Anaerolineae bacterium]|nr:hypothetical protein [Anaerolineae bacterium]